MSKINCTFECKTIKKINDLDSKGNIKTSWSNLRLYNLYIFKKRNNIFSLCWNESKEPATDLFVSNTKGLYACDYQFIRGRTYYLYFSHKKLTKDQMKKLKTDQKHKLIKVKIKSNGAMRIEHSFFAWLYYAKKIEMIQPNSEELIEKLLGIFEKDIQESEDESKQLLIAYKWIKDNRFILLPDGKIIDIYFMLQALKNYLDNDLLTWKELLKEVDDESLAIYENNSGPHLTKYKSYDDIWAKTARKTAFSISIVASIYGAEVAKQNKAELKSLKKISLLNVLEDYFYAINEVFKNFKADIRKVENGVIIKKYRSGSAAGKIRYIKDITPEGTCGIYKYDKKGRNTYRLEGLIDGPEVPAQVADNRVFKTRKTVWNYRNNTMKISYYDQYGIKIKKTDFFEYNAATESYAVIASDEWMVNSEGHVIVDYKQYIQPEGNIIMNNNRKKSVVVNGQTINVNDVTNVRNYFRKSGCILTSICIVDTFFRNEEGKDQFSIDEFVDTKNLWTSIYYANIKFDDVVTELKYNAHLIDQVQSTNLQLSKKNIDSNIFKKIPTFIRIAGQHTAVIGGVRKDNNDNITHYLIRDPGSSRVQRKYIDCDTLANERGNVIRINWIELDDN